MYCIFHYNVLSFKSCLSRLTHTCISTVIAKRKSIFVGHITDAEVGIEGVVEVTIRVSHIDTKFVFFLVCQCVDFIISKPVISFWTSKPDLVFVPTLIKVYNCPCSSLNDLKQVIVKNVTAFPTRPLFQTV